jgi:SAM-dependent methyltransferase
VTTLFDTFPDLYDQQYAHYRDDLAFYVRLVADYGGPVLELGAGSGRVTAALARAGHEVVAVERAEAMLERAEAHLQDAGLIAQVQLVHGDMRALELEQSFPLVIAPFNTLMHAYTLPDQDATLQSVRRHLAPGGRFACDLYNPNGFGALGVLRREAEWSHVGGEQAELFVLQEHDPTKQLLTSRYYLDTLDANGSLTRRTATLLQRYYTRFELERALQLAGFTRRTFFGGFDKRPYRASAPHLIAVAG